MKYVSLFAGIGGFDLALNRCGMECVYANEWDKYAAEIYNRNFQSGEPLQGTERGSVQYGGYQPNIEVGGNSKPETWWDREFQQSEDIDTRDITTVATSEIPDHDLLVGGFPCQAFSIAGKRRGFDDTRGTLFFEIARILKDKQPKFFVLENVKGLLSHDGGNTFKTIISTLTDLGYDLQWQVLNSKNFGVPQNRERVFIIGNLRGERRPEVFPIRGYDNVVTKQSSGLQNPQTAVALRATDYKGTHNMVQLVGGSQGYRVYDTQGVSSTLAGEAGGIGAKTGLYAVQPLMIRRLTPTECERLQGFPDGWTEGVSDTQRYKCLGNAVTVNVVEYIASKLLSSLGDK